MYLGFKCPLCMILIFFALMALAHAQSVVRIPGKVMISQEHSEAMFIAGYSAAKKKARSESVAILFFASVSLKPSKQCAAQSNFARKKAGRRDG